MGPKGHAARDGAPAVLKHRDVFKGDLRCEEYFVLIALLSAVKPSVDIHDEAEIPSKFIKEKITFEVDKDAIRKALDEGEEIPGARLIQTYGLRVYPAKKG